MMMRSPAVAFTLLALISLSGCGPGPATDPTSETEDPGTVAGALMTATWDATMRVPKCGAVSDACTTGGSLVLGRSNLGPEPHQPNTIYDSCADGASGVYHSDESIDRITISTLDGSNLEPGKDVRVDVVVWAYTSPVYDSLGVYLAADATSPVWTLLETVTPTAPGPQTLSIVATLPAGGPLQAVRAAFRYDGTESPCDTGSYDDRDDLVFAVGAPDTTPPSAWITAPEYGATVSGNINLSADASDDLGVARVDFHVDDVLRGSDAAAPYSVVFNTSTVANGWHYVTATAYDASGNWGTSDAVWIYVSNVLPPELVINGGFEGSLSPWVPVGTVAWTNTGGAHAGTGLVKLGGANNVTSASVYEQISIPSSAPANLTFWLNVETEEYETTAYDYLYVEVRNTSNVLLATLGTFSNQDETEPGGWVQKSGFSLASWRGQTIRLRFRATTDGSLLTTFRVDDVSLR